MALTREQIAHLAHLARLDIGPDEAQGLLDKLTAIVAFVDQLRAVDTAGIEPMAHPLALAQRLRPDEVTEPDQRELFQQNASGVTDGLYTVPRVIE